VSRREQIQMATDEVAAFLSEHRIVICATNGPQGWPHLMPLWYVMRGEEIWAWTYAKSQKVRNLERDSRATLEVEDGELYNELRGVMIQARTTIHHDIETVAGVGTELLGRYAGGGAAEDIVRAQAAKRVGLQFTPERIATWDHRKLGGVY
jgi:PPOX class probable F420-dependent enzyme